MGPERSYSPRSDSCRRFPWQRVQRQARQIAVGRYQDELGARKTRLDSVQDLVKQCVRGSDALP